MKVPTFLKATALAAALGFAGTSSAAIFFDVNGDTAPGGKISTSLFDWFPDNVLFDGMIPLPAVGVTSVPFTLRYQATLGAFGAPGGNLDLGTEVTIQAVLPMVATVVTIVGTTSFTIDAILAGGTIDMYYDDTGVGGLGTTGGIIANDITGLGYGDGRKILHGSVLPTAIGDFGTINIGGVIAPAPGLLDQFGADNQAGVLTVAISGNLGMDIEIDPTVGLGLGFDPAFFVPDINGDTVDVVGGSDLSLTIDNTAPFKNANPSDSVVGVAPDYGSGPGVYAGEVNDGACAGGSSPCDLHAEADGRSPFNANLVPEPATLAMLSLGLLGMGASRKRRSTRG